MFPSPTRMASFLERLRTSFWFLPSMMAVAAIVLSFLLTRLDVWLGADTIAESRWLYKFGPEGARAILSAIAGSMITVAGLTFSITMLSLQLASSQFGPRLLRNFMRDRGNQIVLGTFIATFLYCLLVLRSVRGTEESHFVPHVSAAFGVVLALASLAVLIYFIHHIAVSIRIETVLAELAAETRETIDKLYPDRLGEGATHGERHLVDNPFATGREPSARTICTASGGYVQRVDVEAVLGLARDHDLIVRIDARPGRFVYPQGALLTVVPAASVTDEIAKEFAGALVIGDECTPEQDLAFSLRRIVEIAQRALSPGINDPTTALYCIDRLCQALTLLAARRMPSPLRVDSEGRLRVVTETLSLADAACPAFAAIARYGVNDRDVVERLILGIDDLRRVAPEGAGEALMAERAAILDAAARRACIESDAVALRALRHGRAEI